MGGLQADHLDGSVPASTNASTPISEGRVQKKEEESKFDEMLRLLSSINDRMGRSEDRMVQSEQAIKAIIAGQVGTVTVVSSHIDTDGSGQDVRGPRVLSMDLLVTGETADGVSSRSEHTERSLMSAANNPSPAYMERSANMEAIYSAGKWKWKDTKAIVKYLQELYRYDATTTGVAIGSNIVSLMQHRAWLASDSISCKQPSLTIFTKFFASYANYKEKELEPWGLRSQRAMIEL